MRRVLALLPCLALAAVAAGCSGRDAQEAQALVAQSQAAMAKVRSSTFTAKLWAEDGPQQFSVTMSGGGYAKGKHAGDFYVVMSSGEGLFEDIVVVQQSGKVSARIGGTIVPGGVPTASGDGTVGMLQLDRYVKGVKVEHGKLVGGEAATKITGVIDTAAFVKGSLGALPQLAGLEDAGLDIAGAFGDTRAVYYLSESSHLPLRALVDLPMDVLGEEFVLHMDFAYTSFDEKLTFPRV